MLLSGALVYGASIQWLTLKVNKASDLGLYLPPLAVICCRFVFVDLLLYASI